MGKEKTAREIAKEKGIEVRSVSALTSMRAQASYSGTPDTCRYRALHGYQADRDVACAEELHGGAGVVQRKQGSTAESQGVYSLSTLCD